MAISRVTPAPFRHGMTLYPAAGRGETTQPPAVVVMRVSFKSRPKAQLQSQFQQQMTRVCEVEEWEGGWVGGYPSVGLEIFGPIGGMANPGVADPTPGRPTDGVACGARRYDT